MKFKGIYNLFIFVNLDNVIASMKYIFIYKKK